MAEEDVRVTVDSGTRVPVLMERALNLDPLSLRHWDLHPHVGEHVTNVRPAKVEALSHVPTCFHAPQCAHRNAHGTGGTAGHPRTEPYTALSCSGLLPIHISPSGQYTLRIPTLRISVQHAGHGFSET